MKKSGVVGSAMNAVFVIAAYWMTMGNTWATYITWFMVGANFGIWLLFYVARSKLIPLIVQDCVVEEHLPFGGDNWRIAAAIDLFVGGCCLYAGAYTCCMLVMLALFFEQKFRYLTYGYLDHVLNHINAKGAKV